MERYIVPVQVQPLEDSEGYLAMCPVLPGCHAEGKTYAQAIDNLQDVAGVHIQLRLGKGLDLPEGLRAERLEGWRWKRKRRPRGNC